MLPLKIRDFFESHVDPAYFCLDLLCRQQTEPTTMAILRNLANLRQAGKNFPLYASGRQPADVNTKLCVIAFVMQPKCTASPGRKSFCTIYRANMVVCGALVSRRCLWEITFVPAPCRILKSPSTTMIIWNIYSLGYKRLAEDVLVITGKILEAAT